MPWLGAFEQLDGVHVDRPQRWIARWPKVAPIDNLALAIGSRRWKRKLDSLDDGPTLALLFHPGFTPYLKHFNHDAVVYHAVDLFRLVDGSPELERNERELTSCADRVLAVSQPVGDALKERYGCDVALLPNGVDARAFEAASTQEEPHDLAVIPQPRIGYVGRINKKIDLGLVAERARLLPQCHYVMVGPVSNLDDYGKEGLAACRRADNVHFLGLKTVEELPRYTAHMSINIMCYREKSAPWVSVGYPLKMHEYLAAGPPVVSAPISTVRPFENCIALADSPEEWVEKITDALDGREAGTRVRRQNVARANTWDRRVDLLESLLLDVSADL